MLGNSPKTETTIQCERAKSFSLGLWFLDEQDNPFDLSFAAVSFVMREKKSRGYTQVISELFGLVNGPEGYVRLDLQAADLDLDARDYEYVVTLKTEEEYTLAVLKGDLTIVENPESAWVNTEFGGLVPTQSLTVKLGRRNNVYVTVGMPVDISFTIGTITTVDYPALAQASITGKFPNFILNLTLPRGPAG